jgi:ER-bound oxygenase mpaB/B'/Rubber oxygenase, catalytic domain
VSALGTGPITHAQHVGRQSRPLEQGAPGAPLSQVKRRSAPAQLGASEPTEAPPTLVANATGVPRHATAGTSGSSVRGPGASQAEDSSTLNITAPHVARTSWRLSPRWRRKSELPRLSTMFEELPSRFRPTEQARHIYGDEALLRLGRNLLTVDPAADRAVAAMPRDVGGRALERALAGERSRELPSEVVELVAVASEIPSWVDWASVERGGAIFVRAGLAAGVVLGMSSLLLGYASPGGNKPLVFSGRLQAHAARRLAETTRFVHEVSRAGGMRASGGGFASTVKVRVMHAHVRRMIGQTGRWNASLWGEPINQHDMLATTLLFGVAALVGMRQLGYDVNTTEAEDVVHLWRLVGHVIGVDAQLLPANHAEALRVATMIRDTQGAPDDDARALAKALFSARATTATNPRERRLAEWRSLAMQGVARSLIGDALADELALPRSAWRHLGLALRPALRLAARANRLPVWRDIALQIGDHYWDAAGTAAR